MTIDDYFDTEVRWILNTVTETLYNNPSLPFHQVEQIFFQRWWKQASAKQQEQFRTMYNRGQIEFLNGGWVMHDDAVTTYTAMIDKNTLGHNFINDIYGPYALTRTGWTNDTIGLSSITAKINKLCKMDYHVITRVTFEVKQKLSDEANLDFLWKFDSTHNDTKHQLFTHIWHDGYCT
jgi:lysosomal alpha-mannosidase